jgi:hypothetical protein
MGSTYYKNKIFVPFMAWLIKVTTGCTFAFYLQGINGLRTQVQKLTSQRQGGLCIRERYLHIPPLPGAFFILYTSKASLYLDIPTKMYRALK